MTKFVNIDSLAVSSTSLTKTLKCLVPLDLFQEVKSALECFRKYESYWQWRVAI